MPLPIVLFKNLALAVKYETVQFPFDANPFLKAISKQGYILPDALAPLPIGARVNINGFVGSKPDASLRIDADKQVLAIHAATTGLLIEELDAVEEMLASEFGVDSPSLAQYYEFVGGFIVSGRKNPLEAWTPQLKDVPLVRKFSEALDMEVVPYGVQLFQKGAMPNQVNWFDVTIEPKVQSPTSNYNADVVFRHAERSNVVRFVRKAEDALRNMIMLLEE